MYDLIVGGRSIHFYMIGYQNYIFSIFQNNLVGRSTILKELLFSVNGYKLFDEIPTNR